MTISNKIKTLVAGGLGVVSMGLQAVPVFAAGKVRCPDGTNADDLTKCKGIGSSDNNLNNGNLMTTLNQIINVIIGVIGFIAVIVIILGGVQYTTSAGEASKVKKAKDTIMYGVVGLIVALLAYSIVNFVLSNLFGK